MILLSELLDEDGEAAAQAKQMGLISKGWGRWADPRTGKVTHKTDGGQLVAVDPQQDKSGGEKEIGPKPTQSKLGQIAKDLKGKVGRASTKRQRAKAGADTDFDAVEKLRQITSSPQDFEKASKMYHQGHDMKDIEAQFGNKKKPSGGKEPDLDRVAKDLDVTKEPKRNPIQNRKEFKAAKTLGPIIARVMNDKEDSEWGGKVNWEHDTETGEVNATKEDGSDYGSIRGRTLELDFAGRPIKHDYTVTTPDGKSQEIDNMRKAMDVLIDANKDKPKSKYDDPKYKKGDWWDDPELQDEPDDFERQMMTKTSADRAAKKTKRDAEFKKDNEKWADARAKKFQSRADRQRPSDMSTGNPKYDKFLNTVEDKVKNLDVNIGDTYSPEEFAQKSGISPDQQKAYHKLYRSTETWEVPAFELIPGKEGKTSVFIPDPQDV